MKNMAKSLIGLILYVVLIFGLAYVLGHFVVGQVIVDGPSMNETLYDQDRVLILNWIAMMWLCLNMRTIRQPIMLNVSSDCRENRCALTGTETFILTDNCW